MKWIKQRENQIFFSVTLVSILVAISPLISRYCLLGHDSSYHILRIEALKQQIEMGKPFLKVNPTYFGGMGYASSLFYPDFLLYIPALLRVCGFSINNSYHLFMILCVVFCYAVAYYCGKSISKNRYIGILSAVILTLCAYHLDDIIVRAAVGEYTAFIFVPLVVYGVYNLCFEDMDKPWILGAGMAFVLLCHTLSFAMCMIFIVLMLLLNFDVFIKKPKLLLKLIVTGLVTMFITISYWLPILEQFMSTTFYVSYPWIEPVQEAVKVSAIFGLSFPTLGIGLFILIIPRVLLFRKEDDSVMKYADQCLTLGIAFALFASEIMPWKKLGKIFSMVQFPWRFYVISSVLLSISAAIYIYRLAGSLCLGVSDTPKDYDNEEYINRNDNYVNKYGIVLALVLAIMTITTIFTYSNQTREYFDFSNDYFDYKPYTATVIAGEWLPESVDNVDDLLETCDNAYGPNGEVLSVTRDKNTLTVDIDKACTSVDVPFVYYKGYVARNEEGMNIRVDGKGINGLTRVYTGDYEGRITVSYEGTIIQKLSNILSLQTTLLIVLIVYTFYSIRRELYYTKSKDLDTKERDK